MPIIIWGSRGITYTADNGTFYCPQCDGEAQYALKQVRPFFTLYWIPLFPIGTGDKYVECNSCRGSFAEDVLEMEAPSEGQRLFQQIFTDLQHGASLEDSEKQLFAMGMEANQAHNLLEDLTEGKTWTCTRCNQRYLNEISRCRTCQGG